MNKKRTRDTRETPKAQTAKAQTGNVRYSYFDCLRDKVPTPAGVNGTTLYQMLMVGFMVLFVLTVNGVGESGASFFTHSR